MRAVIWNCRTSAWTSWRIECQRCNRAGSYRLDGLTARFGADNALHLLLALAQRERRADFSNACGALDPKMNNCPSNLRGGALNAREPLVPCIQGYL
jgi:hypothetical protein